jgi:hypothetical protein
MNTLATRHNIDLFLHFAFVMFAVAMATAG